jgi:recombinational DNA repair ATPase RecF
VAGVTRLGEDSRHPIGRSSIRLDDGVEGSNLAGPTKAAYRRVALGAGETIPQDSPVRPSLLLDDLAVELDNERLTGLIGEVSSQSAQLM